MIYVDEGNLECLVEGHFFLEIEEKHELVVMIIRDVTQQDS